MSTAERWRFHPTVLYLTSPISLTHSCLVPKSSCFFFSSPAIPSLQTQRKCRQKPYVVGLPKIAIEVARNHRLPIHRIWALFSPIYRVTAAEIPTPACTVTRHGPAGCGYRPFPSDSCSTTASSWQLTGTEAIPACSHSMEHLSRTLVPWPVPRT